MQITRAIFVCVQCKIFFVAKLFEINFRHCEALFSTFNKFSDWIFLNQKVKLNVDKTPPISQNVKKKNLWQKIARILILLQGVPKQWELIVTTFKSSRFLHLFKFNIENVWSWDFQNVVYSFCILKLKEILQKLYTKFNLFNKSKLPSSIFKTRER